MKWVQEPQYFQNSTNPFLVGQGMDEWEVETQERMAKRWILPLCVLHLLEGPSWKPGKHSYAVPGTAGAGEAFPSWFRFLPPLPLPLEGYFWVGRTKTPASLIWRELILAGLIGELSAEPEEPTELCPTPQLQISSLFPKGWLVRLRTIPQSAALSDGCEFKFLNRDCVPAQR